MFRDILNNHELTDNCGNPVEIAREQSWGLRKKLDECLNPRQCDGIKTDCWLEVGIKSERGITRQKLIKFCDLRWKNEPILNIKCG